MKVPRKFWVSGKFHNRSPLSPGFSKNDFCHEGIPIDPIFENFYVTVTTWNSQTPDRLGHHSHSFFVDERVRVSHEKKDDYWESIVSTIATGGMTVKFVDTGKVVNVSLESVHRLGVDDEYADWCSGLGGGSSSKTPRRTTKRANMGPKKLRHLLSWWLLLMLHDTVSPSSLHCWCGLNDTK